MIQDTIVAISTATTTGAIAIVRLSGLEAIDMVSKIFTQSLNNKKSHTITYGHVVDPKNNEIVDEVMVSVFLAPKTYTKEDIVEINCHGGPIPTNKIVSIILGLGARLAEPGEFTQRAFINGRIDLVQAEAVNDLILATSDQGAKIALDSMSGALKEMLVPMIDEVLGMLAHIEVNIDYPEYEDIHQLTTQEIFPNIKQWLNHANTLLDMSEDGQIIKEGIKTVILGKPNVGKSSLLNALLNEEKAIVTPVAGTTRDLVEGWVRLKNIPLHLIDTAGIQTSEDVVEQIGISRTLKSIDSADLVLLILDASEIMDDKDQQLLDLTKDKNRLIVYNKSDLVSKNDSLQISALNKDIQPLIDAIEKLFEKNLLATKQPLLNNQRQIGLFRQACVHMESALNSIAQGFEVDIITIDLQQAYEALTTILHGHQKTQLIDEIFKRFCLGK